MMSFSLSIPLLALTLALSSRMVNAHGYVQNVVVGGQDYTGWLPFTDPYANPVPSRIVRKIPDDGPILSVSDSGLACNTGGEQGAKLVADAAAGSKVTFEWTNWPADHLGPVSVYMASCNGDCTNFDVSGAKWFKIDAAGYTNKVWASTNLIANNNSWTTTIPSQLAPGEYLMRNEIVALHDAGAPQYYPSCSQVKVSGSGTQQPPTSDLVSIPGLYDNTVWPDIWSDSFNSFTIPGPPVAFSSSGGSSQAAQSTSSASSPSSSASSQSSSASPSKAASTQAPSSATANSFTAAPSLPPPTRPRLALPLPRALLPPAAPPLIASYHCIICCVF
ncbi:Polysaccharide monooxygenase Cel61a [Grifola frondosa]|uniref:lytic cellulose monooxygenase (C4-dehydrogenating) n=1 Tax=Grifola frondosa TaxID=5627 RepID=A0A1C7LTZ1_GRIFR|nr:Polysaccharide monooxygenase Cel61a [Grifola frondosa]